MSYKRDLKNKAVTLLVDLMKSFVDAEQAALVTKEAAMTQLGKRSYFKDQVSGAIKLGLCYRQVRKEVKKNPNVTVADIKRKHKLG
jgi:hypothetical protein